MTNGMDTLRNNELMRGFIDKMFDYDLEVAELESEMFSIPAKMEITFNCIDLSFQLFPSSSDEISRWLLDIWMIYADTMTKNLVSI